MQKIEQFTKSLKPKGFTGYHFAVMLCIMHEGPETQLSQATIGERTGMSRYTVRNVIQDFRKWKWISYSSGKQQYNTSTIRVEWENLPAPKLAVKLVVSEEAVKLTESFRTFIWEARCKDYPAHRRAGDTPAAALHSCRDCRGQGIVSDVEGGHVPLIHSMITEPAAQLIKSIPQIPGAVRNINASPDPLGHYANVAEETAGQSAGQALTGIAAAKLPEVVPEHAAPLIKSAVQRGSTPTRVGRGIGAIAGAKLGPMIGVNTVEGAAGGGYLGGEAAKILFKNPDEPLINFKPKNTAPAPAEPLISEPTAAPAAESPAKPSGMPKIAQRNDGQIRPSHRRRQA